MMFKRLFLILILSIVACSDDDIDCIIPELGQLETEINGNILFQARATGFSTFETTTENLFITSLVVDQNCLLTANINMTVRPNLERQDFLNSQFRLEAATISFVQFSDDQPLGRWSVLEEEDNWIQLDEISEISISGMFQAILTLEDAPNNLNSLPDTLRFNNVRFIAPLTD